MRVLDVLTSPWAIQPSKLQEICAIYRSHACGEKADLAAIEAAIGRPLANERKPFERHDGVAVVSLQGVIAKRMNIFSSISGGVSTQLFQQDMAAAADDPSIRGIIVSIDSPGGAVDGTQAAMNAIRQAREKKTVVAVADGLMASAAYWIGSAAEQVYIADDTTEVGSIGVVATHEDWSRYENNLGVTITEITAGKYKRIAGEHAPLTQEGRASIQDQLDQIYTIFVNDVAANRGKSPATVVSDMADGRIFIGRKAVEAGLADGVRPLAEVIRVLNQQHGATAPKRGVSMEKAVVFGVECASQAEVDAALQGVEKETAEACSRAVAGERARIAAIESAALPGHEALVARMKADGTPAAEAAMQILAAEKAKLSRINADLAADAPPPAPSSEPAAGAAVPDAKELARLAGEYMDSEARQGRKVSYAAAVAHFTAKGRNL